MLVGAIRLDPATMAGASAALLGGIVVWGSNNSTAKEARKELVVAEAQSGRIDRNDRSACDILGGNAGRLAAGARGLDGARKEVRYERKRRINSGGVLWPVAALFREHGDDF